MKENICPYFNRCGGCLYQDLPQDVYITRKENFIKRSFSDYGLSPDLEPIRLIPAHTRRRATFAFQNGHLGFNALKTHHIVDIDDCLLLTPPLVSILKPLRDLIKKWGGSGDISVLDTPFGIDMHLKTAQTKRPSLNQLELLTNFAAGENIARLILNKEPILEKTKLPFPPDSFLQPSLEGEQTLIDLVLENITTEKKAVDLFCGCGTFTKPLLQKGLFTIGYDCEPLSVSCLGQSGIVRDLFRNPLLPDELNSFDLALIDPPRAGAKAQTEQLADSHLKKIIMISCNPQTAGRDSKILIDSGFSLKKLTPVDQFIYSNHIEIVLVFEK